MGRRVTFDTVPPTLAYVGPRSDRVGSAVTTHTHSSLSFGATAPDRVLIVAIAHPIVAFANSVTVGGVAATLAVRVQNPGGTFSNAVAEIYAVSLPTGTSGDVVIVFPSVTNRSYVAIYRATGLFSVVATGTATATANGAMNVNIPSYGVMVGNAMSEVPSGTNPGGASWSGATQAYSAIVSSSSNDWTTGATYTAGGADEPSHSVQCSGMSNDNCICVASFR